MEAIPMAVEQVQFPPEAALSAAPRIIVAEAAVGTSPLDRYRTSLTRRGALRAGAPLVALVRIDDLATPDTITAREATRAGQRFTLTIVVRRFSGTLFANVETTGLVQADLGRLASGRYELEVEETVLSFDDIQHPERAADPQTDTHLVDFSVSS
jgi:hypothetical protein